MFNDKHIIDQNIKQRPRIVSVHAIIVPKQLPLFMAVMMVYLHFVLMINFI